VNRLPVSPNETRELVDILLMPPFAGCWHLWHEFLTDLCKITRLLRFVTIVRLPFSFKFRSLDLSLFHKWFWKVLYALLWGGILSRSWWSGAVWRCYSNFFLEVKGMVSGLSAVICLSLRRVWHLYRVLIISLGWFRYWKICFKLSRYWLWRDKVKFEIFREHVAY